MSKPEAAALNAVLRIEHTWRGRPLAASEQAVVHLSREGDGDLHLRVEAPFYSDPPPPGPPGSLDGLWEYEVVEVFLVDASTARRKPRYLEIELSPHGHHLVLQLHGVRERTASGLPLGYATEICASRWRGEAVLASRFLPPAPWLANAFAIHGVGPARQYAAANPVPGDRVDFHCPDRFPLLSALGGQGLSTGSAGFQV